MSRPKTVFFHTNLLRPDPLRRPPNLDLGHKTLQTRVTGLEPKNAGRASNVALHFTPVHLGSVRVTGYWSLGATSGFCGIR